eukprot:SAG31_NODE_7559_length_1653_cov_3.257420_2_plen_73_part_01
MVAKAVRLWGRLDIFVSSAIGSDPELVEQGIEPGGSAVSLHPGHWDYQISLSITAIFRAVKAAVPQMIESGGP